MYMHFFAAMLLALPLTLGCGGGEPGPVTVTEDDRQQMAEHQKSVEEQERAHQAQSR